MIVPWSPPTTPVPAMKEDDVTPEPSTCWKKRRLAKGMHSEGDMRWPSRARASFDISAFDIPLKNSAFDITSTSVEADLALELGLDPDDMPVSELLHDSEFPATQVADEYAAATYRDVETINSEEEELFTNNDEEIDDRYSEFVEAMPMLVSDSEHETEAHEEDPVETDDEHDDHSDVDAEEFMRLLGGSCSVDDPYFEVPDDEDGPATDVTESVPAFLERTDLDDQVDTELHKSFWEKLYGIVGGETEVVPDETWSHNDRALFEAMRAGGAFNVQSSLGVRFFREHKADTRAGQSYASLPNRAAKKEYRDKWALLEFKKVAAKKSKTKSWQRIDTEKGVYMSMLRIAHKEGGSVHESSVAAARRYVQKALAMGPPWVRLNPMTDRLDFLYLTISYQEEFKVCWSQYTDYEKEKREEVAKPTVEEPKRLEEAKPTVEKATVVEVKPTVEKATGVAPPGPADPKQQERPAISGVSGDQLGTGGAPNGGDLNDGSPDTNKGRGKKSPLQKAMSDANQIKTRYDKVNGELQTVDEQIHKGETSWLWAQNEVTLKEIREQKESLLNSKNSFAETFLVSSQKQIRALYTDAQVTQHLKELVRQMTAPITNTEKLIKRLKGMREQFVDERFKAEAAS